MGKWKRPTKKREPIAQIRWRQGLWKLSLRCHLCSLSKVIPCPRIFSRYPMDGHCQTDCWSHFLPLLFLSFALFFSFRSLSLSILIINWGDETGFICKTIPNGSFGCCWVAHTGRSMRRLNPGLVWRAKESLQREPQPRTYGLYPSPSPRPRKRGVCRPFQGAGLMGKSWQVDQGKLTPSLSCFMKAWQTCTEQRKAAEEREKIEMYSKRRDRSMKSVPSPKVSVRALLCPSHLLSLCGVTGFKQD